MRASTSTGLISTLAALTLLAGALGCKSQSESAPTPDPEEGKGQIEGPAEQQPATEAPAAPPAPAPDPNIGPQIDPLALSVLREFLPEKLGALTRKERAGRKAGVSELVKITEIDATYENAGGRRFDIKVIDMGTAANIAYKKVPGWGLSDHEKKGAEGFERTTTFAGHKAFETFKAADKITSLHVFLADRFVVEVHAPGDDMKQIHAAAKLLDLTAIAALPGGAAQ